MERRDGEKCLQRPLEEGGRGEREGLPPSHSKVVDAGVSKAQRRRLPKHILKLSPYIHRAGLKSGAQVARIF